MGYLLQEAFYQMRAHGTRTILEAAGFCLLLSTARGQFLPALAPVNTGGSAPTFVAVGNFNTDKFPDLAVSNTASNTVTLLMGKAAGGFTPGSSFQIPAPGAIAVADFNGDGFEDLAIVSQTKGNVTVLLLDGAGNVRQSLGPYATGSFPSSIAAADLNGDTYPDLAVANRDSGTVSVLLWNNSTQQFGTSTSVGLPTGGSPTPASPSSVVAGVFNANGLEDLAVADEANNMVTLLINSGKGSFKASAASPYPVGSAPSALAAADFNGDGNFDLAVANLNSDFVTLLLGNGTDGFTTSLSSPFQTGLQPISMVTADFNGDRLPDLAIANAGSNNVTVLLNNGAGGFTAGANSPVAAGPGPVSIAVGDFNGDGVPDLVVANPTDASVTVLLNGSVAAPTMVSAASYAAAEGVSPGETVTILGTYTNTNVPSAPQPESTCFDQMGVTLTDNSGTVSLLNLFYVGPTQINAVMPASAATGAGTFRISSYSDSKCQTAPTTPIQKGTVTVNSVAPSLFTANQSGKGVAAAQFVSSHVSGLPPVFSCSPPTNCQPVPLDVSSGTTFLVLYGTGIRNRVLLSNVTVTIGSLPPLPALFAGMAPLPPNTMDAGLDQVNVALPASLAGTGTATITVSVGSAVSNPVTVCFTNPQNSPAMCGLVTPYLY